MKIKSIISDNLSSKARYNDNISKSHLEVTKSDGNEDKKDYASIMILNLMNERGFFDVAFSQVDSTRDSVVDKLFDNAEKLVKRNGSVNHES